jgi:hypothetical protein
MSTIALDCISIICGPLDPGIAPSHSPPQVPGPELVALKKYFDITPKSDNPDKLLTSPGENREFVEKLKILL